PMQEDVVRLDVAVNKPVSMRFGKHAADRYENLNGAPDREFPFLVQLRAERASFQQLHNYISNCVCRYARVENHYRIRMIDATGRDPFQTEAIQIFHRRPAFGRFEDLNGDRALQIELRCTIDRAVSSHADLRFEKILSVENRSREDVRKSAEDHIGFLVGGDQFFVLLRKLSVFARYFLFGKLLFGDVAPFGEQIDHFAGFVSYRFDREIHDYLRAPGISREVFGFKSNKLPFSRSRNRLFESLLRLRRSRPPRSLPERRPDYIRTLRSGGFKRSLVGLKNIAVDIEQSGELIHLVQNDIGP